MNDKTKFRCYRQLNQTDQTHVVTEGCVCLYIVTHWA